MCTLHAHRVSTARASVFCVTGSRWRRDIALGASLRVSRFTPRFPCKRSQAGLIATDLPIPASLHTLAGC